MRFFIILLFASSLVQSKPLHWNQFRGPDGNGDAGNSQLPVEFSEEKNLTWKTSMPGKAWSSPVVKDGKIWV
ncbi:MAG: serine/threonine protein kinase, partial [Opitutae bacterium]